MSKITTTERDELLPRLTEDYAKANDYKPEEVTYYVEEGDDYPRIIIQKQGRDNKPRCISFDEFTLKLFKSGNSGTDTEEWRRLIVELGYEEKRWEYLEQREQMQEAKRKAKAAAKQKKKEKETEAPPLVKKCAMCRYADDSDDFASAGGLILCKCKTADSFNEFRSEDEDGCECFKE